MGWASLTAAVLAAGALALPGDGMFLAMGLGLFATGAGLSACRAPGPAAGRLAGAGATTLGGIALAVATAKVSLSLAAISALTRLLS
jgi:hypothetical protein